MTLLEELEEIAEVNLLTLDCNDGVSMKISRLTPQIVKDFVRYQSIDKTGWIYVPKDKDKINLAIWFLNRGCIFRFILNQKISLNWYRQWQIKRKVVKLNKLIGNGGLEKRK